MPLKSLRDVLYLPRLWQGHEALMRHRIQADEFLARHVKTHHTDSSPAYEAWRMQEKNLDSVALTARIAEQLCQLRGKTPTTVQLDTAYLFGAARKIGDDLLSARVTHTLPDEVMLYQQYALSKNKETLLFSAMRQGLEMLVSNGFRRNQERIIEQYNNSKYNVSNPPWNDAYQLRAVKRDASGSAFLLLYALLDPNEKHVCDKITLSYSPEQRKQNLKDWKPICEGEAIYRLGALAADIDTSRGVREDWSTINDEILYVQDGLERFFRPNAVLSVMQEWKAQATQVAVFANKAMARLHKPQLAYST